MSEFHERVKSSIDGRRMMGAPNVRDMLRTGEERVFLRYEWIKDWDRLLCDAGTLVDFCEGAEGIEVFSIQKQ